MRITKFNAVLEQLVEATGQLGTKGHVLVAHDEHATIQLKDKRGIQIVGVMPSTTYSGMPDAFKPHRTTLIMALEKDIDDQRRPQELDQYQRTQDVINAIVDWIDEQYANGCSPFPQWDPKSITIDPEYREYGGFNGWSMTLSF